MAGLEILLYSPVRTQEGKALFVPGNAEDAHDLLPPRVFRAQGHLVETEPAVMGMLREEWEARRGEHSDR